MYRLTLLTFSLALAASPEAARAAHPFATDDPGTLGPGAAELELQVLGGRGADCDWHGHLGAGLALHAGITPTLDVGVGLSYEGLPGSSWSVADPMMDAKWRFLDQRGAVPALALRVDYRVPQVLDGVSSGHGLGGLLAATWEGAGWLAGLNVGAMLDGLSTEAGHTSLGLLSALALRTVAEGVHVGGEALWAQHGLSAPAGLDLLAALLLDLSPSGSLSLGAGPHWRPGHAPGWSLSLGWTHAFTGASR